MEQFTDLSKFLSYPSEGEIIGEKSDWKISFIHDKTTLRPKSKKGNERSNQIELPVKYFHPSAEGAGQSRYEVSPESTVSRYSSSHQARKRLLAIPTFSVLSFFNKFNAIRFKIEKFSAP